MIGARIYSGSPYEEKAGYARAALPAQLLAAHPLRGPAMLYAARVASAVYQQA